MTKEGRLFDLLGGYHAACVSPRIRRVGNSVQSNREEKGPIEDGDKERKGSYCGLGTLERSRSD